MTAARPWPGAFISLEGGEGAGKSTQAQMLAAKLTAMGKHVVSSREPGGVPQAEDLRALLLTGAKERWSPMSEALIMYAARVEHWRGKIEPALLRGDWVVCDRFADSSMAYQGIAGGVGRAAIERLHALALGSVQPDLTLVLDIPAELGLERAAARVAAHQETATRFEMKTASYHVQLAQAFREIAAAEPKRCVLIRADRPADQVAADIWTAVQSRLAPSA